MDNQLQSLREVVVSDRPGDRIRNDAKKWKFGILEDGLRIGQQKAKTGHRMSAMASLVQALVKGNAFNRVDSKLASADCSRLRVMNSSQPTNPSKVRIQVHRRTLHVAAAPHKSVKGHSSEAIATSGVSEGALNTTKHLLAGAAAAMVSRTAVAPLERLKLEYMVRGATCSVPATVGRILKGEGVLAFWRGNGVNLLRTTPFKSVNFFAFDYYRKLLIQLRGSADISNWERLGAGAAAGVTATVLCFPLDTLRTRMVAQGGDTLPHLLHCLRGVLASEGVGALYRGLLPAVLSMAPAGAVFYGTYDLLRSGHLRSAGRLSMVCSPGTQVQGKVAGNKRVKEEGGVGGVKGSGDGGRAMELGPMRTLVYGALAGAAAETATFPFEVVRRHLQLQGASQRVGALATVHAIVRKGGPGALYTGLLPSVLQVLPSAALSYFVYEALKTNLQVQ